MEFDDNDESGENLSGAQIATQKIDDHNKALTEAEYEKLDDHNAELSDTTNKPERFGVGENSHGGNSALRRQARSTDSFTAAATAHAYQQSVTLNLGGRTISMSLGDLRHVASDLRNQYGDKVRNGGTEKDRTRMKAFDGLINLLDQVAAGEASPDEVNKYIQQHGLDKDIAKAAENNPAIIVNVSNHNDAELAQEGSYATHSAEDLNKDVLNDFYPTG